jgi:hypothetical protein
MDFKKILEIKKMPKNTKVDDPFSNDDFWGPGSSVSDAMPGSERTEMPDAPTEERPQFLKPAHVMGKDGKDAMGYAKLVRVTSETSEMSDVVLLVEVKGKHYRVGLKIYAEAYKAMLLKFGKSRKDWSDKELVYKVMPHGGKEFGFVDFRPKR